MNAMQFVPKRDVQYLAVIGQSCVQSQELAVSATHLAILLL